MRKLLALLLAMVMTLGLATVGTNAASGLSAYEDADEVAYTEAAEVLTALSIIQGKDGKFGPTDELKRSEGATIIARMILGKSVSDELAAQKYSEIFTSDMSEHWAGGYVDYLAKAGIIGGKGKDASGKDMFDPDGTLTTAEFAKMLLTALGYDAKAESLVGADWAINTAKLAAQTGLFSGNSDAQGSMPCSREQAALYALNALKTPLVQYDALGRVEYMTSAARDTQTISFAQLNEGSQSGVYMVEFAEKYFPALRRDTQTTDEWGRPSAKWTLGTDVISNRASSELLLATYADTYKTGKDLYELLGGATLLDLFANNQTVQNNRVNASFRLFVDGREYLNNSATVPAGYPVPANAVRNESTIRASLLDAIRTQNTSSSNEYLSWISGAGRTLEVYLDTDSYANVVEGRTFRAPQITLVVTNTWLAQAVAAADGKLTVDVYDYVNNYGERFTEDDTKVATGSKKAADFKAGDYLLVNVNRSTGTAYVANMMTAKTLSNSNVASYTVDGGKMETVTAGGTKYSVTKTAVYDPSVLNSYTQTALQDYSYTLFTDADDSTRLFGITNQQTNHNLAFVTSIGTDGTWSVLAGSNAYRANVILANEGVYRPLETVYTAAGGSARTWLLNNYNNFADDAWLNVWFTYSLDANGRITLVDVVSDGTNALPATLGVYRQASANIANAAGYPEISSLNPRLTANFNGRTVTAVGGADSIYINATYNDVTNTINGIARKTTGIANTTIDLRNTNFGGARFGENNSNVFFVYNTAGYVMAAVAVGSGNWGTVSQDYAYIYSGPTNRTYTDTARGQYLDTYKAVVNGVDTTLTVSSAATGNLYASLTLDRFYGIDRDANGNVISITQVDSNWADVSTGNAVRGATAVTAGVDGVLFVRNGGANTLNVINMFNDADGEILTTGTGVQKFFVQTEATKAPTAYNTLAEAWNVAVNGGARSVKGVYTFNNAAGFATSVVLVTGTPNAVFLQARDGVAAANIPGALATFAQDHAFYQAAVDAADLPALNATYAAVDAAIRAITVPGAAALIPNTNAMLEQQASLIKRNATVAIDDVNEYEELADALLLAANTLVVDDVLVDTTAVPAVADVALFVKDAGVAAASAIFADGDDATDAADVILAWQNEGWTIVDDDSEYLAAGAKVRVLAYDEDGNVVAASAYTIVAEAGEDELAFTKTSDGYGYEYTVKDGEVGLLSITLEAALEPEEPEAVAVITVGADEKYATLAEYEAAKNVTLKKDALESITVKEGGSLTIGATDVATVNGDVNVYGGNSALKLVKGGKLTCANMTIYKDATIDWAGDEDVEVGVTVSGKMTANETVAKYIDEAPWLFNNTVTLTVDTEPAAA